jgi:hypothetical protein
MEEIQFGAGNDVICHGGDGARANGGGCVVHGDSISAAKEAPVTADLSIEGT